MARLQALVAALALSLGGWQCGAISGHGSISNGAFVGARAPAADGVVGIDWPFEPTILYEAGKETLFADSDPVQTPTQFGTQTEVAVTQAVLADRPVYQSPCDVGPAIPCFYDDGTDYWQDSIARASLAYLHSGAGMTCYLVAENSNLMTGNAHLFSTGARTGTEIGVGLRQTSSTTDRWTLQTGSSSGFLGTIPVTGTGLQDQTWASVFTHGTARSSDQYVEWRGVAGSGTSDYAFSPSTADPSGPLTVGRSASGTLHFQGHWFAIACDDALHDATMIEATFDAIEAVTGVLPQ